MTLVLDTNAYSDWRRFGRWNENLAYADRVMIPAIVIGELHAGFRRGSRFRAVNGRLATRDEHFAGIPHVILEPER